MVVPTIWFKGLYYVRNRIMSLIQQALCICKYLLNKMWTARTNESVLDQIQIYHHYLVSAWNLRKWWLKKILSWKEAKGKDKVNGWDKGNHWSLTWEIYKLFIIGRTKWQAYVYRGPEMKLIIKPFN